ncbi:MAG: TiaS agmantine-binding domain-containing protein [Candidatus Natronoplasma sp.]
MFIAVDDTDSRKGMCTTFLATELIKEFDDYRLLDYPRLVRLNPNVPWKTRGNGAIVLSLGEGSEKDKKIGEAEEELWIYQGEHVMDEKAFSRARNVVETFAHSAASETNPGLIVSENRTPEYLYERAVKGVVKLEEVLGILEDDGFMYRGYGKKRGLIGASAALAWRPNDFTYELLSYRREEMWGESRDIKNSSVKKLDKEFKHSFDSYDRELNKQTIAPTSPCPVLYGVRGDHPLELQKALDIVEGELPERWVTFLTNQATDDHIQKKELCESESWNSVRVTGDVSSEPRPIEGGHVLFEIDDGTDKITAAAYEPTKSFRDVVNKLIEGDRLELYGGIRKEPRTLNIEKMRVIDLEDKIVKVSNPECPNCGKNMSSMGKNAGYRCKRCRTKADEDEVERKKVERNISEGWYEVPVSARRHLSKPLKRMG